MSSAPGIKRLNLRKASGEIKQAVPVNRRIKDVETELSINYDKIDDGKADVDRLKVGLLCIAHTAKDADINLVGRFNAEIEIVYEVVLTSKYDERYIDHIMYAVWPYLRAGAMHQLKLLDVSQIGDTLPFDISTLKPPRTSQRQRLKGTGLLSLGLRSDNSPVPFSVRELDKMSKGIQFSDLMEQEIASADPLCHHYALFLELPPSTPTT